MEKAFQSKRESLEREKRREMNWRGEERDHRTWKAGENPHTQTDRASNEFSKMLKK